MTKLLSVMLCWALIAVANFATATFVFAHQQKAAETTVLFNKNSNKLEVMHRFYLHDTEHAVKSLFDKNADILESTKTQSQFANYVAKQFLAKTLSDKSLSLISVGHEVEGKFFWVYQEADLPTNIKGVNLYNGSLRDLWPMQVNMVNIEGKGKVKTLYFSENKDWISVRL